MDKVTKKLFELAKNVRKNAYAPYSNYKVGATVLTEKARMFAGCNVENVTYTLTTHAEMNAIDNAIASGDRKIKKLVLVTDSDEPVFPCALCRQKIIEFSHETEVIAFTLNGKFISAKIGDLYPKAFTKKNLEM